MSSYPPPPAVAGYIYTANVTLTANAGVWTLQAPPAPTKNAVMTSLMVSSPTAACQFALERDGGQASATAGNTPALNPGLPAAQTLAFAQSNATPGTIIGNYVIPAGAPPLMIDLAGVVFWAGQVGRNLTMRTTSMSGQVLVIFKWYEQ